MKNCIINKRLRGKTCECTFSSAARHSQKIQNAHLHRYPSLATKNKFLANEGVSVMGFSTKRNKTYRFIVSIYMDTDPSALRYVGKEVTWLLIIAV